MTSAAPSPAAQLLELIGASWSAQAIGVAAELRIADLIEAGARTADELAERTRCAASPLHRLLRALASLGLCEEHDDGTFDLTPCGELLRSDAPTSLRSWALWCRCQWPVWGELLYSVRTGKSARDRLSGSQGYELLERDPESAAIFNRAMLELTRLVAGEVIRVCDLSRARRLVDVGGGYGELLFAILRAFPALRGLLFDLPHALEDARARVLEAGMSARCEVVAGDFFDALPAGADVYLLKSVLHNWDDLRCGRILRNCRRAMAPGARLVLVERVMPWRMARSASDRAAARADLSMLVGIGGRERTQGEFEALLAAADLEFAGMRPTATDFSVIEAIAA